MFYLAGILKKLTKNREITGYKPALRKALKNLVLKDQDVEIRSYFDKNNNRQFDISNLRYEEMKSSLQKIINKPLELPHDSEKEEKANKLKEQYDKAFAAAASHDASDKDIEYWKIWNRQKRLCLLLIGFELKNPLSQSLLKKNRLWMNYFQ